MRGLVEEGMARGILTPMQRVMYILEATRMYCKETVCEGAGASARVRRALRVAGCRPHMPTMVPTQVDNGNLSPFPHVSVQCQVLGTPSALLVAGRPSFGLELTACMHAYS